MSAKKIVEAVLFSSSKPLSSGQIRNICGLKQTTINDAVVELNKDYSDRGSALEILNLDGKYYLQLKKEMLKYSIKTGTSAIPKKLIRALALVAYHQPVRQSLLKEMMGPSAYDHIKELVSLKLIYKKKTGNTYVLTTTGRFIEMFGIDPKDKKAITQWIQENVAGGAMHDE